MNETYSKEDLLKLPFMNDDLELEERVDDLLGRLTLEEKFSLCAGKWLFYAKKVKRLGIPYFKMTDGPHGVGATGTFFRGKYTAFPAAICRTATWNLDLAEKYGIYAGEEIRSIGRHCILGPGINIIRTPLCGRNFEYQTEDPYLNKTMAIPIIKGFQSQRVAACVKHYAANNQEHNRFRVDAQISERALQEIYLPAFEATVREADVWSFMSCYNLVNGSYGSEHNDFLRKRLFDEWDFRGFICSDWFATKHMTRTDNAIKAGLTIEMPKAIVYKKKKLQKAIDTGKITEDMINVNLKGLLRVMFLVGMFDDKASLPKGCKNTPKHQEIARQIAEEGIVLLKNENNILPLNINDISKIAVIGPNAKKKHIFGGGSSMQRPKYEITPLKGFQKRCKGRVKITKNIADADVVILVVGLNHKRHMDSENQDRFILELPTDQEELINKTVQTNPNTIIILVNGSPIAMSNWLDKVPAVIEAWYGGMEAGNAIAAVIFGDVNPSGKLPVTFPKKLSDCSMHNSIRTYPRIKKEDHVIKKEPSSLSESDMAIKEPGIVYYEEGVFVGYRYFDKKNIEPLFPFGYGLSYTTFKYENIKIDKQSISGDEKFTVSVDISNTGKTAGAEVAQLYVQDVESSVERPLKELKGFKKVKLDPDAKETILFELGKDDLSFYDEKISTWIAEKGQFNILVGSSSRDIRIGGKIDYLG